jgi:hypothetical protein
MAAKSVGERLVVGVLTVIIFALLLAVIIGAPVMWLWNALVPDLFDGPTITFWQAVGITILGSLLTGLNIKL